MWEVWERLNTKNNEGFIDFRKNVAHLFILPLSSLAKLVNMSDGSLNACVH